MSVHAGPRAAVWFGKKVKAPAGTELGPDAAGRYGKVSETGRWFTYEWWFGHHFDRDSRGEWGDDDKASTRHARRQGFGSGGTGTRKESPSDRQRREGREYAAYCHERFQAAEKATHGVMVTPAGRSKGYTGADFFDPDARRRPGRTFATDELRAWLGDGDTATAGRGGRGLLSATTYREQTKQRAA